MIFSNVKPNPRHSVKNIHLDFMNILKERDQLIYHLENRRAMSWRMSHTMNGFILSIEETDCTREFAIPILEKSGCRRACQSRTKVGLHAPKMQGQKLYYLYYMV